MIACSICKEMFSPAGKNLEKEVCPKCVEANDKKTSMSRLAPRLGQRHALPFDRGVARTISYGDKVGKQKPANTGPKADNPRETKVSDDKS